MIYVNPGNWLNYAVTAPVAGTYVLSLRASNGGSTAGLQVRNSSGTVLATVSIPNTGGWQQYATVTTSVILPAGAQTLQLYCSKNNWNLNWWELVPPGTSSGRRTAAGSFLVEAEDYIAQNSIITEASSDVSGTLNTVHSTVGSWADYRITVPVAGTYTVKLRIGSTGSGILKLRNAVGADLATLNLASTGGLQQYTTVAASVSLSGGTQTLRLYTEGASFTVNRLEIVTPPGTNNYALQLNNHPANGGGFISDAVNDFTVEFWIKAAGTHQIDVESNSLSNIEGVAGQPYAIFPVHGYGSGDAGMGVSVGTNGVSVYEHADGYMPPLLVWESSTPLADWVHVAIVYRNKQPSLYINGNWVKDGQVSQKNNVYAGLQFPGGHYGGTGGEQMDEVRVWKYARTEQQIRDNRQGEILGTTPGLAGYWPMNEGSGTVLHDISGNGRDIDLSSAGYNNSNWVSGRYTISNQEDLYRYAFNSKERDQDIGEDNYDYGMRIHDARLGRFLSVDPLSSTYPMLSTYQYASNRPIDGVDQDGMEWRATQYTDATTVRLRNPTDRQTAYWNSRPQITATKESTPPMSVRVHRFFMNKTPEQEVYANISSGGAYHGLKVLYGLYNDVHILGTSLANGPSKATDVAGYRAGEIQRVGAFANVAGTLMSFLESGISAKANFEELGYNYKSDVVTNKNGSTDVSHYLVRGEEKLFVGQSEISKDGTLTNVFQVPKELQKRGVSKAMYAELGRIGFSKIESSYLNGSGELAANYLEFMKVYDVKKGNMVEAAYATPAGKALGKGWTPTNINVVKDKVTMEWVKNK